MSGRGRGIRNPMSGDAKSGDSSHVLAGMAQLERFMEHYSQGSGQSSGWISRPDDQQERFRHQRPQEFTGTTDPFVAEIWIKSLDVIFDYLQLSELDKPRCAIFMLRRDAIFRRRVIAEMIPVVIQTLGSSLEEDRPAAFLREVLRVFSSEYSAVPPPLPSSKSRRRRPCAPPPRAAGICSGQLDEKNPSTPISSGLLVQTWDTASRGPTTIVAPESQFRTYPTDHDSIGYPRMSASGESSTTMHGLLHASGSHPIRTPYDPKRVGKRVKVRRLSCRVSMTFRVVRTNQYNQDLGLIHSTNGNHLESPNEGSSKDHQVTIYLHAQNITMFPTNET
ncbi:hypothetical protein F511_18835 [Dorcoceras hygrometricum]|uniref:Uncharacterized protein n=1 Tax=Dorcoceras hygrometricum TaxID=472368 RepID=A0A2Z7DB50_9LAMI|nr:hypothetical protein F511_18835 [Dorcoceras hygrometricum]